MQYGYVFAPPPPPIPLLIHSGVSIHQSQKGILLASLPVVNHIKLADKSLSDDMMDISDSDSENDKPKQTSLLPPPPPPPRLPFFFK